MRYQGSRWNAPDTGPTLTLSYYCCCSIEIQYNLCLFLPGAVVTPSSFWPLFWLFLHSWSRNIASSSPFVPHSLADWPLDSYDTIPVGSNFRCLKQSTSCPNRVAPLELWRSTSIGISMAAALWSWKIEERVPNTSWIFIAVLYCFERDEHCPQNRGEDTLVS